MCLLQTFSCRAGDSVICRGKRRLSSNETEKWIAAIMRDSPLCAPLVPSLSWQWLPSNHAFQLKPALYIFVFLLAWRKGGHKNINMLGHSKLKHLCSANLKQHFIRSLKKHQCLVCWRGRWTCLSSLFRHASCQDRLCKKCLLWEVKKKQTKPPPKPPKRKTLEFTGASPLSYNIQ